MRILRVIVCLALALASFGPGVHGLDRAGDERIIIRHDRPDDRYLALGAEHAAVVRVGQRMGDGTLIGDRWVLTAAHVARGLMRRSTAPAVVVGAASVPVARAFLHPEWKDMGPHDIGVLELTSAVKGVAPLALYDGSDEAGQTAVLVGHGRTGTGASRERFDDDRKRGATNRVERVERSRLVFRFDAPPGGTDLEGIPGAGDSGGPALLRREGRWLVAGVSSAGQPGRDGPGTYDALDFFTRVSTHAGWVREVMAGRGEAFDARAEAAAAPPAGAGVELPDTPAGRRLRALIDLVAGGDERRVGVFLQTHVRLADGVATPSPETIARYQRLVRDYSGARVVRVMRSEPHHVDVLVATAGGERLLGVQVEPRPDGRIIGVFEGRL